MIKLTSVQWNNLGSAFGESLQRDVPLARFTAARVGGTADALIITESADLLANAATTLWDLGIPFLVLGGGSNVLISDAGIREVVILNRAREMEINEIEHSVWAGSGVSFGQMARKVSARGLGGLEWASGIPGTVGGAVFGNAGAHGGDVAGRLLVAEILHQTGSREHWTVEEMDYSYRSSMLKRDGIQAVILSAQFQLERSTVEASKKLIDDYASWRKEMQPPGASMGSMFKNPKGDYAGKLIEQAGLKGTRMGCAAISSVHANFFINYGGSKSSDILALIKLAQKSVCDQFDVDLALEIELLGEWEANEG